MLSGPSPRHHGDMVPPDVMLRIGSIFVFCIAALITAADLPLSVLYRLYQLLILNVKIRNYMPFPLTLTLADILSMTPGVLAVCIRGQKLRWVLIGDWLALEAGQRSLRKHFIGRTDHRHHLGAASIRPQLTLQVFHLPGAGYGHIAAN